MRPVEALATLHICTVYEHDQALCILLFFFFFVVVM